MADDEDNLRGRPMTQAEFGTTETSIDFRPALTKTASAIRAHRERREDFRAHDSSWHVDTALKNLEAWEMGDDAALSSAAAHVLYALQLDQEQKG